MDWKKIRGLLIDLDGVLTIDNEPLPGAVETLQRLRKENIPFRICTNTTTKSNATLTSTLNQAGLDVEAGDFFSAPIAAARYLRKNGFRRCYLLMRDDVKREFSEFEHVEKKPEVIVVGDIGEAWNYQLMSQLFAALMDGVKLVAMHKGKYWKSESTLKLDIGAFIVGLEYATGEQSILVGKPSRTFFEEALSELGLPPEQVAMVGDDIDSDVGGAQRVGIKGVLVSTGKFRKSDLKKSATKPDDVFESIEVLLNRLGE
jgi:HAD superfamily hydrolase (TIGR01458 family)